MNITDPWQIVGWIGALAVAILIIAFTILLLVGIWSGITNRKRDTSGVPDRVPASWNRRHRAD